MSKSKVNMFDVDVAALTMRQTVDYINNAIREGKQIVHACLNAYVAVLMDKDSSLKLQLQEADIVSADGQSVVWASSFYSKSLPERVPGPDLMDNLIHLAAKQGYKVFLLGARENVVKKVADYYNSSLNSNVVTGYKNGYFDESAETELISQINNSGAQLLFVAIPSPQKETFISKYRSQMPNVLLLMGVGGSFDIVAGEIQRAPRWVQNIGMEWFFRLIQEPRKMWKRYLVGNLKFIYLLTKNLAKHAA